MDHPQPQKDLFITLLEEHGVTATACKLAGVTRRTMKKWRDEDPDFAEQMDDVLELTYDVLEKEARRRAVEGVEKNIYYKGEFVTSEMQYSDALLTTLLKAKRPDEFGDKTKITGDAKAPLTVIIRDVAEETRDLAPPSDETAAAVSEGIHQAIAAAGRKK